MRKIFAAAAFFSVFTVTACSSDSDNNAAAEKTFFAMDTAVSFRGDAEDAEKAEKIITELDLLFDRYSKESDVYALNSRSNTEISEDTSEIISKACELSERYGQDVSIFAGDITDCWNIGSGQARVPSETEISQALESFVKASFSLDTMSFADDYGNIDLGSVAKGFALDKVKDELGEDTFCIVSANSSILINGSKHDGEKFTVSVRNPEIPYSSLGIIRTDACFVSTSGGYERFFEADGERYSHIFDLKTGRPSETDLTSVTVICDSGIESDFLSTLIYLGGTERLGEYLESDDFRVVAVTGNNAIYLSKGIDFELDENCGYEIKEFVNE